MENYQLKDLSIAIDKEGAGEFTKVSFPIRYGRFSEMRTQDYIFQFNQNGEIKFLQGKDENWPHPGEWLKRTVGNDWIYYSSGNYGDVYDLIGEYYYPHLSYPSNAIFEEDPFRDHSVRSAIRSWPLLLHKLKELGINEIPGRVRDFIVRVVENSEEVLRLKSERLKGLLRGHVTVLPPDSRHVDYEVIPIIVADGCLYHCGFCRVKSKQDFARRPLWDILEQIKELKRFYARDLPNYNSIFLGQHDALYAGQEVIQFAVEHAYDLFDFRHSYLRNPRLFLFGSPDSIIQSDQRVFEMLNSLPFLTYINVGLESADPVTLGFLKKPVSVEIIREAFLRMPEINRTYEKIEVTANFILGEDLSQSHLDSIVELTRTGQTSFYSKGAVYLSPLVDGCVISKERRRTLLRKFREVKMESPLPAFLYLIQRL